MRAREASGARARPAPAARADPSWDGLAERHQLGDVSDVGIGPGDRVYLLTRHEPAVIVCDPGGTVLDSWGAGVFTNPHGLTVAPDGTVYIADNRDHIVARFTGDGDLLGIYGTRGLGSDTGYAPDADTVPYLTIRRSAGPFNRPTKVCVLTDGTFFVADGYGNAAIHRFSAVGAHEYSWGEPGDRPGQFRVPHGIAASPDEDRLFVCDRENSRIQVFTPDGTLTDTWDGIRRPSAITAAPDGLLYVAELGWRAGLPPGVAYDPGSPWSTLAVLDQQGRLVARLGSDDPCSPGSFYAGHGIAADSTGAIYVAEVPQVGGKGTGGAPGCCHALQKLRLMAG